MTRAHQSTFSVQTHGEGFTDVTRRVEEVVAASGVTTGLCSIFIQHTSASLVIQENADPDVLGDLGRWITRIAPQSSSYRHDAEGPDDMPSHLRSAITRTSEVVPIVSGKLGLGTWQAIYIWEHRAAAHRRFLVVTVIG